MAENNSGFEVWLCNKDKKVLKIVIDKDKIIKIIGRHKNNQRYLPMFLQNTSLPKSAEFRLFYACCV